MSSRRPGISGGLTIPIMPSENSSNSENAQIPVQHGTFFGVFPKWWGVACAWLNGNEKWLARAYFLTALIVNLLYTIVLVQVSYAQRKFSTALSEKHVGEFYEAIWHFVGIIFVAAPLFAFSSFLEDRLGLAWRVFLVKKLLKGYFSNRAFFMMSIFGGAVDNPDQRICEDVENYVHASVILTMGFSRKVFSCVAFAGVLWSISHELVIFLFAYAIFGTWITTGIFGKPLMRINYTVLQQEGNLRFSLVRVRENAESIAFYSGDEREKGIVGSRFEKVVATKVDKINWQAGLSLWSNVYSYATILVPSLMTAPRYFAGEIEFGAVTQATYAFNRIESAVSTIVNNFQSISGLAAQTERLVVLLDVVEKIEEDQMFEKSQDGAIKNTSKIVRLRATPPSVLIFEGVSLNAPGARQVICSNQDLTMLEGESLLIVGPSGCGKSSLLRAISGLWTFGQGTIRTPLTEEMFFLPQRPYMPLGTLKTQLLFPSKMAHLPSESKIMDALKSVRLGDLVERIGGMDVEKDWTQVLSLGEQQRIAILRLLLHAPSLAFLDEATSAMDIATEESAYKALSRSCPSYVSVGHRLQLVKYHTHVLEWQGGGVWVKYLASEFQQRSQFRDGLHLA